MKSFYIFVVVAVASVVFTPALAASPWKKDGCITIRSRSQDPAVAGRYVTLEADGRLRAGSPVQGPEQRFQLYRFQSTNFVVIKSMVNGLFVTVENDPEPYQNPYWEQVRARSTAEAPAQGVYLALETHPDGGVALTSFFSYAWYGDTYTVQEYRYVSASGHDGWLMANLTAPAQSSSFDFVYLDACDCSQLQ